ncbi:MAG: hypothetical protein ABI852_13985 [Gemmatimonadaceae bacterium]
MTAMPRDLVDWPPQAYIGLTGCHPGLVADGSGNRRAEFMLPN